MIDIKDIKVTPITTSQVVHRKRCILVDVIVDATAVTSGSVTIYDGTNNTGKKIITIKCPADDIRGLHPRMPFILENGLYIEISGGVEQVLVLSVGGIT